MPDLYLRFANEAEAIEALAAIGIDQTEGTWPATGTASDGTIYALDLVFGTGIIMRETGETLEGEYGPVPVMEPRPGYHINMVWRGETVPDELAAFNRSPANPACVWA